MGLAKVNRSERCEVWTRGIPLSTPLYSITVYPFISERVNHYTVNFDNMLTLPVTYGKMFLGRKGCGRRGLEP